MERTRKNTSKNPNVYDNLVYIVYNFRKLYRVVYVFVGSLEEICADLAWKARQNVSKE